MIWLNENNPHAAQWLRNLIDKGHLPHGRVDDRSILAVSPAELTATQCHFFAGIGGWPYALDLAHWPRARPVWTASLPCQPLSVAGQRQGHVDERHLWPAFHDLVAERRPATIFGEQVASADGREWLAAIRADLESLGYAVGAACLPACSVGAPHLRYRLYWVAHLLADADRGERGWRANTQGRLSDGPAGERNQGDGVAAGHSEARRLADADPTERRESAVHRQIERDRENAGWAEAWDSSGACSGAVELADADRSLGGQGSSLDRGRNSRGDANEGAGLGRHGDVNPWADLVWLPCRDGKYRPTQPGLFPLAHGVSKRVVRLRGYGNAIVPQVAAEFIKAYLEEHPT